MSAEAGHRIPLADAERLAADILVAAGTPLDNAARVAHHLADAEASGHASHGLIRIPQYVGRIRRGELIPDVQPLIVSEAGAVAVVDGLFGFGQIALEFAADWAGQRATQTGIAAAAVRHATHTGRLGAYVERLAMRGLASVVTVGAAGPGVGGMAPTGGRERFLGANPWVLGIPSATGETVVVDVSMSTLAQGKVTLAAASGESLPPGAILDQDGQPTNDPSRFEQGSLVPLGGELAGHKGYGLALASALLGGLAILGDPTPSTIGASVQPRYASSGPKAAGALVIAIDPGHFGSPGLYLTLVEQVQQAARQAAPRRPDVPVRVPGDPERASRLVADREGLLVAGGVWQALIDLADELRVDFRSPERGDHP
jgi:uncharacterized oxidoreductase